MYSWLSKLLNRELYLKWIQEAAAAFWLSNAFFKNILYQHLVVKLLPFPISYLPSSKYTLSREKAVLEKPWPFQTFQGFLSPSGSLLCVCVPAKSLQSCSTLFDPMDCIPPGSSVHSLVQIARDYSEAEEVVSHTLILPLNSYFSLSSLTWSRRSGM